MNTITYGFKKATASMSTKLVVCNETKQFEMGVVCQNSTYVDVWVKYKDLLKIQNNLVACGYTKTGRKFGENTMDKMFKEYREFCKDNGLNECHATSLDAFKAYLKTNGRNL